MFRFQLGAGVETTKWHGGGQEGLGCRGLQSSVLGLENLTDVNS